MLFPLLFLCVSWSFLAVQKVVFFFLFFFFFFSFLFFYFCLFSFIHFFLKKGGNCSAVLENGCGFPFSDIEVECRHNPEKYNFCRHPAGSILAPQFFLCGFCTYSPAPKPRKPPLTCVHSISLLVCLFSLVIFSFFFF